MALGLLLGSLQPLRSLKPVGIFVGILVDAIDIYRHGIGSSPLLNTFSNHILIRFSLESATPMPRASDMGHFVWRGPVSGRFWPLYHTGCSHEKYILRSHAGKIDCNDEPSVQRRAVTAPTAFRRAVLLCQHRTSPTFVPRPSSCTSTKG